MRSTRIIQLRSMATRAWQDNGNCRSSGGYASNFQWMSLLGTFQNAFKASNAFKLVLLNLLGATSVNIDI
ncbi:hypothetical protein FGO68_gene8480 [Halteria grandinella]|uniref:Uncharacterized protein n=1 Tax=Halteria grandinella TaxID=5974 RepID=A0A8J8SYW2_HALGN|nr:hypothetical protein FGO68_gene8480 [Halteria grandinella]